MRIVLRDWNGSALGPVVENAQLTRHSAHLAIAPAGRRWVIYHVPSGCKLFDTSKKAAAIAAVAELAGLTDWGKRAVELRQQSGLSSQVYRVSVKHL